MSRRKASRSAASSALTEPVAELRWDAAPACSADHR